MAPLSSFTEFLIQINAHLCDIISGYLYANCVVLYNLINAVYFIALKDFLLNTTMREVFEVSSDNKSKVEEIFKKDEEINRGSITIRTASSLDMEGDYFIILDTAEDRIKKAKELVKELAKPYKNAKKVLEKIDEQEDSAIEGFGNILG